MAQADNPFPFGTSGSRSSQALPTASGASRGAGKGAGAPGPDRPERSRLGRQMMAYFLLISLVPLGVVAAVNFLLAKQTLLQTETQYLEALAARQIDSIRTYLFEMQNITSLVAMSPGVWLTLEQVRREEGAVGPDGERLPPLTEDEARHTPEGDLLPSDTSPRTQMSLRELEERHAPGLKQLVSKLGFNRLYLVDTQGRIVFSLPKMPEEHRNLLAEDSLDSNLTELYLRTERLMTTQAGDFRLDPSTGEPALYLSAPVLHEGKFLGVVILAPKNEDIYAAVNNYGGLSESGDVLLASREGDRILFLNDPRYSSNAAFNFTVPYTPEDGQPLMPVQRAVRGESGGDLTTDYRGKEVLAGWKYLPNLRMGLVVKIDKDEVFQPVMRLATISFWVAGVTVIIVLLVAFLLSRGITRPILNLTQAATLMADGDLTGTIICRARNEIGQLANSARHMAANLKSLIGKVKIAGGEISKTAQHISASTRQQVTTAEQTGVSSVEVNATARQISTTAQELAGTMRKVNEITQQVAVDAEADLDLLQQLQTSMSELSSSNCEVSEQLNLIQAKATAISSIILTMTKVADQTNLLSLNASIEARKAGEAGRGFSVVATEIRRLADQAAVSTLEIESSVKDMLQAVSTGVSSMSVFSRKVETSVEEITGIGQRLTEVIQQVQGLPPRFDQIQEGMQSQASGASQINEAMAALSSSAQQTAASVRETHRMLDNLRRSADILQSEISRFKT
ncbi:MAG: methyl-accepting chemotaxis protein [Verrucomicrobiota bacterium JB024]|nr:methyl-accepting chemotaxis protein [Verrucomicrobiota bacterium JB024]